MAHKSNILIFILHKISGLISLAAIGFSIHLFLYPNTACQKFLQYPVLTIGLIVFVVSLLGAVGSCGRINFALYPYLVLLLLIIVGLICFTVLSLIVTNDQVGKTLYRNGIGGHKSEDYSKWLQNHVVYGDKWDVIKSCLLDSHVCSSLGGNYQNADQFYQKKISLVQSGCCKPPRYCGLEFKNATYWTVPKSGPAVQDSDCTTWSNDQNTLCMDCKSCKREFLGNIKREWRVLFISNMCALLLLIIIYSFGCCAAKNNHRDHKFNRYRGYV